MSLKSVKIPGVGMRNVKTALAAAFCAFIYYFFDRSPAFACIGAIFGMGSDMEDSRKNGGNRLFGTLIGGLLGMVLFRLYLFIEPTGEYTLWLVPLTFIGTVILIVLCQMFCPSPPWRRWIRRRSGSSGQRTRPDEWRSG